MGSGINLTSVFIADFIGVLMLFLLLFTKGWVLPTRKRESKLLFILIIATLLDCLVDPFAYYFDGKPGKLSYVILFLSNTVFLKKIDHLMYLNKSEYYKTHDRRCQVQGE